MGRPPTFDHARLAELLRSGQYTSHSELAAALSTPGRRVTAPAVGMAVMRLRRQPEFADLPGFQIQHGKGLIAELERNTGRKLSPAYMRTSSHARMLRVLSRLRRGVPVGNKPDEVQARNLEASLREIRCVIDLDGEGRPYIRPAMLPDELDTDGNVVEIIAQHPLPLPPVGGPVKDPLVEDQITRLHQAQSDARREAQAADAAAGRANKAVKELTALLGRIEEVEARACRMAEQDARRIAKALVNDIAAPIFVTLVEGSIDKWYKNLLDEVENTKRAYAQLFGCVDHDELTKKIAAQVTTEMLHASGRRDLAAGRLRGEMTPPSTGKPSGQRRRR